MMTQLGFCPCVARASVFYVRKGGNQDDILFPNTLCEINTSTPLLLGLTK